MALVITRSFSSFPISTYIIASSPFAFVLQVVQFNSIQFFISIKKKARDVKQLRRVFFHPIFLGSAQMIKDRHCCTTVPATSFSRFYSRGYTSGTWNASVKKELRNFGSSSFSVSLNNERKDSLLGQIW